MGPPAVSRFLYLRHYSEEKAKVNKYCGRNAAGLRGLRPALQVLRDWAGAGRMPALPLRGGFCWRRGELSLSFFRRWRLPWFCRAIWCCWSGLSARGMARTGTSSADTITPAAEVTPTA